jgi:hypothetical protein
MKQTFLSSLFFLLLSVLAQAQDEGEGRASAIYFEGFGNSLYYGLNYDTRFQNTQKGLGGSVGFGAYQNLRNEGVWIDNSTGGSFVGRSVHSNYYSATLMVNYLWGKGPHSLEVGGGATFFSARNFGASGFLVRGDEQQFSSVFGTLSMMYRLHLPKSLFLRAGWTPFFGPANDGFIFIPYQFGLGIGYAFQ